jgi:Holliday junction resolvasome RuvABC endonuclease subunit
MDFKLKIQKINNKAPNLPIILGIDPGAHFTGIVIVQSDKLIQTILIKFPLKIEPPQIISLTIQAFIEILKQIKPELIQSVLIEKYRISRKKSFHKTFFTIGAIMTLLTLKNIPFKEIPFISCQALIKKLVNENFEHPLLSFYFTEKNPHIKDALALAIYEKFNKIKSND